MAFNQPATFDELWSDERVKGYLHHQPPAGENADFNALYNAYKHMRATDFERFLVFFAAEGRDIHALNPDGKTLLELVKTHPVSLDFVTLLSR
ncbi:MAG: hypothetical protein RJA86_1756 [Pseudomonadota bacterium]|jgi:hypothetical protein